MKILSWALLASCTALVSAVPFHDFISNLSDKVNEIKRAVLNPQNQPRSSRSSSDYDTQQQPSLGITDRFVSRDPSQIRFLIYDKRLSPSEYKEVREGDLESFKNANFHKKKPVKILVHGFNHNGTEGPGSFPNEAKNAYLSHTENTVMVVDWGMLAKPMVSGLTIDVFYPVVVANVPRVGEEIAKMLLYMMENEIVQHPDQFHIIGFSLGAHVAGVAGAYVKGKTDRFIGRITGLDPAAPMFEQATDVERLDRTDADFVDVIHSSRLGLYDRIGHIDFYVNGGRFQADCYKLSEKAQPRETLSDLYRAIMGSCGHSRAPLYFIHSIKSGPGAIAGCGCSTWRDYLATCRNKCKGIVNFGEFCPHTARGVYFLEITVDDVAAT